MANLGCSLCREITNLQGKCQTNNTKVLFGVVEVSNDFIVYFHPCVSLHELKCIDSSAKHSQAQL